MRSEAVPSCPECDGPLSGLGPLGARHWGRKPASPANGYCMECHIGLTRTDGHWNRSAGHR
jgi:hypothetical protein